MKKVVGRIFLVLFTVVFAFAIYRFILSMTPGDGSERREKIEYLNNTVDFALLQYGEDVGFPEGLEYEKIDSLEGDNWKRDNDYVYLIINDLNGTVEFKKEEYLALKEYADKNTNFNFIYIGTDDLDMIEANTSNVYLDDSDMSFGYMVYEGSRLVTLGIWSKDSQERYEKNPELLSTSLLHIILINIRSNE